MTSGDPSDLFAATNSPDLPTQLAPEGSGTPSATESAVFVGTFAGDFLLFRELGRGAFARVYLARQKSLGRLVALKVNDRPGGVGGEGVVLAALDHQHIVKVFAEVTDPDSGRTGLVLQYVSGPHLGEVLAEVYHDGRRPVDGLDLLAAVDRRAADPVVFDPTALADREVYRTGYAEVVCRLGAKLADALAVAHSRGVLHCDLKPSNVLLDRYGRPMLADFNVAVNLPPEGPAAPVGGTLAYMAPEHLAAFGRIEHQPPVERHADLYALGLVLLEGLTGKTPPVGDSTANGLALVVAVWSARRAEPNDWLSEHRPLVPPPVWRVLRRCLAFHPIDRYQSAAELAAALRGAADQLDRQTALPPGGRVPRWVTRHPLVALAVFTFLPHLIGSVVNIAYNRTEVRLTEVDAARFDAVTGWYNLVAYPLCVALALLVAAPIVRFLRNPAAELLPSAELDRLRKWAIRLGRRGAEIAAVGWLPGAVIFPLALTDWQAGIDWSRFGHFAASFTVAGLIAITYSFLGIQAVVVRAIYPRLVHPDVSPEQRKTEAATLTGDLSAAPLVAATVPLLAAVLQTVTAPADFHLGFRLLVTGLIVAGMIGLGVTVWATARLRKLVAVMTGTGDVGN